METKQGTAAVRNSGRTGKPPEISVRNQDRFRTLIKVAEIIEKLNDHILAGAKLTNTQVRAAEILLRKVQPDLLATAITDDTGTALPLLRIVRNPADMRTKSGSDSPRSKVSTETAPAGTGQDRADSA